MNANQRLIFRHKIPQKNLTILGLSLVAIMGAIWFSGGESRGRRRPRMKNETGRSWSR